VPPARGGRAPPGDAGLADRDGGRVARRPAHPPRRVGIDAPRGDARLGGAAHRADPPDAGRRRRPSAPAERRRRPSARPGLADLRSEEHTSELQSRENLVCRLLLEKKKYTKTTTTSTTASTNRPNTPQRCY